MTMMTAGALLVASSCGGSGDDSSSDAGEAPRSPSMASGDDIGVAKEGGDGVSAVRVVAIGRELVSTAELVVVAKDVDRASAAAETAVTERGGFVFGQEDTANESGRATLTLKVPPKEFRDLLAVLADLGRVEQRNVRTDDVTAEGVDLDARIVSAEKSVERVRGFLQETTNVSELSSVEAELTSRETELEQLVGQRRVLDDRVSLATITLTLTAKPAPAPPVGDSLRNVPGFGGALASGVGALVKVIRVVGAGVGYALPFAVVLGAPLLMVRTLRRRRRSAPPAAPTTSVMDPPEPPPVSPII